MNAEIITVGTELLLGDILNSNSQFLSRELAAYGIQMLYQSTVGDNNARLEQVLSLALSRSDMVLITGGLGPTPDDLTRETVCETLGIPQFLHEESWRRIEEYFASTGRELSPSNKKQAMLPEGCVVFPNDHGTAPGCAVEKDGHVVILLPGPPRELIPMFDTYVTPYLSKFSGGTIFSRTVGVFGIPESAVAERLADLLSSANPTVAPYAKDGEVTLRVTARAADTEAAKAMCDPVVEEIRSRLGVHVYGVDSGSLQKAVVQLLMEKQKKIATAESCTAGILSGRLTEVAGASAVFECGIASYSNEIKHQVLGVPEELLEKYGAVSPEVACAMAIGARRVGQADLGVGITGVAGPDTSEGKPVGTVYIALADDKRTWVKKIVAGHNGNDREYVRFVATSHALDLVRRYLEALPAVMAGGELLADPEATAPVIPVLPKTGEPRRFLSRLIPWKGDSPLYAGIKAAVWVLVLALIVTAGILFNQLVLEPAGNQRLYDDVRDLYTQSPGSVPPDGSDTTYPEGMISRFYGLYDRNEDIAGWIKIDGTNIDYPVMKGNSGNFYSNHNYDGRSSAYGVPYFDSTAALVSPQSVNRTLTIYGNNTGNGQMFSDLTKYRDMTFLREHPLVEMNTIYKNGKWKIFAVMVVDQNDDSFSYVRTTFRDEADFLGFVEQLRERSLFDVPTTVEGSDSLLFLSTNAQEDWGFSGARLVVCARAVREGEAETVDMTGLSENRDVQMPEAYGPPVGAVTTGARPSSGVSTAAASNPSVESVTADISGESTAATQPIHPSQGTSRPTSAGSLTTSTTTAGTTASTTTTTPTTTSPPEGDTPTPPATEIYPPSSKLETEFLKDFSVQLADNVTLTASNKEELQLALSYIVKSEMGNAKSYASSTEALKAQAVAAYTFVLNKKKPYDLSNRSRSYINLDDEHDKAIYDAVGEVAGIKILTKSDQKAICSMFFASSPGITADNVYVFGADFSYLKPVVSPYDTKTYIESFGGSAEDVSSTYTISREELLNRVKAELVDDSDNATISNPEQAFQVAIEDDTPLQYDSSGRYVSRTNICYTINGEDKTYLTGHQLRSALDTGEQPFNSHSFYIAESDENTITFQVNGHGHGVGMSQFGAMGYANVAGWTYDQILTHYYSITPDSGYQIYLPNWGNGKDDGP